MRTSPSLRPAGGEAERQPQAGLKHVAPIEPAFDGRTGGAEQQCRFQLLGAAQRQVAEGEAGQGAEAGGSPQRHRIDHRWQPEAKQAAENGQQHHGEERAEQQAQNDAGEGQQHHLGEEMDEDARAGGAERLHGGDGTLAFGDIGGNGVGDAEPTDQQRRQPDDG